MKLLLAGTLIANAALVVLLASRPSLLPPSWREHFVSDTERAAGRAAEKKLAAQRLEAEARAAARLRANTWANLTTSDLRELVNRLRAAGFSPAVIRAIVSARIQDSFSTRLSELLGPLEAPFWKSDPFSSFNNSRFYEAQTQIYRDRTKALREFLGDDYFAGSAGDATAAQRRQFGNLPKSKIDLIQRISDDYAEMTSQVRAGTNGIMLPEDREKFALLEREKRVDLAAILTLAELEDYEMRNSPITSRMRTALTLLNASEAEFLAIYRVQQPFADILHPTNVGGVVRSSSEDSRRRTEAQSQIAAQLKIALGEQRAADFFRASNYEYQNLRRLTDRENISIAAINRAFDLRSSATEESMRIRESKLEPAAHAAAMQTLAAATKEKIVLNLGPAVAETYTKGLTWLTSIERGYAVRISPDGTSTMTYTSAQPAPKK